MQLERRCRKQNCLNLTRPIVIEPARLPCPLADPLSASKPLQQRQAFVTWEASLLTPKREGGGQVRSILQSGLPHPCKKPLQQPSVMIAVVIARSSLLASRYRTNERSILMVGNGNRFISDIDDALAPTSSIARRVPRAWIASTLGIAN